MFLYLIFFLRFYDMDHFKIFIEFVTILLLLLCFDFFFFFFGPEACGVLALWPEVEPAPPALEGQVLTPGPPGKSHFTFIII